MANSLDLLGWKTTTATILVGLIPSQSFESAFVLAETYLSDVGGWNPDNGGDPTGIGQPVNGQLPEAAANSIFDIEHSKVYDVAVIAPIELQFRFTQKLPAGLGEVAVLGAIQDAVENWLKANVLISDRFPVTVDANGVGVISGNLIGTGETTSAERVAVAARADSDDKITDYKTAALVFARIKHLLDDNWNVMSFYTEPTKPITVIIRRYTSTTYLDLDEAVTQKYVIVVNPDTYEVVSGVSLSQ